MKKSFLKKSVSAVAAASLIVSMTACSSQGNSQNAPSDTGKTAADSTNTSNDADGGRGTIQVTIGRQTLQNVSFPEGDTYE